MTSPPPHPLVVAPASVLVRGASDRMADLVGFMIARAGGTAPVVLEVVDPEAGTGSWPWATWVDPLRHYRILAPGARPVAGEVPWAIVRASEPDRILSSLTEFLAAPEAAGRNFGQFLPTERPLPILIANGRPAARQFPDEPTSTAHLLRLQNGKGYLTVFTADRTVRRDYVAFDFAIDVVPGPAEPGDLRWRIARSPPGHPLRPGDEFRLDAFGPLPQPWPDAPPAVAGEEPDPAAGAGTDPPLPPATTLSER